MVRATLLFLAAAVFLAAATFSPDKPLASLPLKDGRTLKNVHLVSFGTSTVMARWDGGRGTIPYADLPDDLAASVAAFKPSPSTYKAPLPQPTKKPPSPKPDAALPPAPKERVVSGRMYVATKGGENRLLADVLVYAFPSESLSRFDTRMRIDLPVPLATATTDEQGRFELRVPPETAFYVFSQTERYIGAVSGYDPYEHYAWIVKDDAIAADEPLILSNRNLERTKYNISIGGS